MTITDKIKLLPEVPGVYRYLDENGTVIYVGKAKNLKKRVSQYFQAPEKLTRKTAVMVSKIRDVEHTVVDTEEDALLLENNLIKEYQPKYNILLKDGKTYPWICVKKEPFPRVFLTRRFKKDGSLYFGPYSSVMHAHKLLDLINALYKLRTCNLQLSEQNINSGKFKVCLNYHIKKCLAPCTGYISAQGYKEQTDAIIEILKGNSAYLIREFDKKMKDAASKLEFESANEFKEKKLLLEKHYSKSMVVHSGIMDLDVFSLIFEGQDAFGNYMKVRNGCIIRSINLHIKMRIEEEQSSVLSSFMAEIYSRSDTEQDNVKEILVPFMPDQNFEGKNVHIPLKGDKLAVLELSRKNAAELKFDRLKQEEFVNPKEHTERILENLRRDLNMEELPRHIECFDNSNTQGTNPVSACVVFKDGAPSKRDYRHFNIKTVVGANDFASMKEVVNRRYTRILAEGGDMPQLIVIDGGKGQVRFAYEALLELDLLDKVKLIGIAERMEELIIPGDPYPLFLDKNSTSLKLIMQLRDEAHRFGITHHRARRSKGQISSQLEQIPGVGPKTIEKLMAKYKTISRIKSAAESDLAAILGSKLAKTIMEALD
ncbi:MAG: excinuclease ABC subunit C [Bacteroidales bacterium]|nr:excinuclease ABC subunit C [Bacteroidales bacterium]